MINSLHKCNFFPMALLGTTKQPQYFTDFATFRRFRVFLGFNFPDIFNFLRRIFLTAYPIALKFWNMVTMIYSEGLNLQIVIKTKNWVFMIFFMEVDGEFF